jgi:hypothetical protein
LANVDPEGAGFTVSCTFTEAALGLALESVIVIAPVFDVLPVTSTYMVWFPVPLIEVVGEAPEEELDNWIKEPAGTLATQLPNPVVLPLEIVRACGIGAVPAVVVNDSVPLGDSEITGDGGGPPPLLVRPHTTL